MIIQKLSRASLLLGLTYTQPSLRLKKENILLVNGGGTFGGVNLSLREIFFEIRIKLFPF